MVYLQYQITQTPSLANLPVQKIPPGTCFTALLQTGRPGAPWEGTLSLANVPGESGLVDWGGYYFWLNVSLSQFIDGLLPCSSQRQAIREPDIISILQWAWYMSSHALPVGGYLHHATPEKHIL